MDPQLLSLIGDPKLIEIALCLLAIAVLRWLNRWGTRRT
jgi:hypothetical protein